jgi:hypothetical protein
MKRKLLNFAAGAAACIALAQPQMLMAQDCVDQDDLSGAVIYAMPILYSAFSSKCANELEASGFVATGGDAFVAKYSAAQDQNWPAASRMLAQSGNADEKGEGMGDLLTAMPEEALRPFVNAIIEQKVRGEIKSEDCGKIERGLEALAPLPPENMGGFVTFLVDMAGVKSPKLCPYEPK